MPSQSSFNLKSKESGPVECLGQTFFSDDARREHYLKLLAEKLKDSEFRKIDGFPIGEDDDILALSDPPYYTACPNPWIGDFIKHHGRPYDPKEKYHREPFAADVSEGKYHPNYKYHPYPTKVPHRAIMRYILHYTEPGDVVFDGFCGTGMTGVAAQLCGDRKEVQELGYRLDGSGNISNESGQPFSRIGRRFAALCDLSPAATFISRSYNSAINEGNFCKEAKRIINEVDAECSCMFTTTHKESVSGTINYTVWSDVLTCPECASEIVFWHQAVDYSAGKVLESFNCQQCDVLLTKRRANPTTATIFDPALGKTIVQTKRVPVLINYSVGSKRYEKIPDDKDLEHIQKIESMPIPYWHPMSRMAEGGETRRNDPSGLTHIHHFYSWRNLWALASLRSRISGAW